MSASGALIEKKVKAFATGMEARMTALRDAKVKEIDKRLAAEAKKVEKSGKADRKAKKGGAKAAEAPKGEDMVVKLTFTMSKSGATQGRTGKQQALEVAEGDSWTCAGSHMNDSARHINMYTHGPGKTGKKYMVDPKKAFGTKDEHICNVATFQKEWEAEMKKQDLRNHGGGKGYGHGDDYHLELPNSRIPKTDPECVACADEYCRLVVMEGYDNNTKFEKAWAAAIKAPMAKYLKEKEKLENAKRIEELKKMVFGGKVSASGKFFSKVKDSKKAAIAVKGSILPPPDIVKEAGRAMPLVLPLVGVPKVKTFTNVTFTGVVVLHFLRYEHLTQTFLKEVRFECVASLKGLLSYAATASASGSVNINLGKGPDPTGTVVIEYSVDGLGPDDHAGQIVFDIKGIKSKI
ncbi:hypothetical protein AB2B41_07395 [Marimonas sp. MJW-29]|uniref:Uncharacterized protein n=1 Tax=Sulfitobacter sediminis TaxID=3234186 RepID=A0ABV3RKL6_9RHOB